MKEIFGKNEASGLRRKKSVIMIISILIVTIFIGSAIQPAIANPMPNEIDGSINNNTCNTCRPRLQNNEEPRIKTCGGAMRFAVEHMKKHVRDNLPKEHYFPKTVDLVLLINQGLWEGIKLSGFKIEIDQEKLTANIKYWVDELYGPQVFDVSKFLAVLGGISLGITTYLLTFCNNGANIQHTNPRIPQSPVRNRPRIPLSPVRNRPIINIWILLLRLLGF